MTNIRRSVKAGVRIGKISTHSSVIHTTNAIESLNSVIRHAIKKRKVFPTDDSVRKVIYLAMSRFIIEFGDRLNDHL